MSDEKSSEKRNENEVKTTAQPPQKRKFPVAVIPILLLVAVGGFLLWYFVLRQPAVPANLIEVSGRVESDDAAVAPKTGGKIKEMKVREGDQVKAGEVIAILDDEQLRA